MLIATWNLNNRVGNHRFHSDTANAAISLDVDILVFTEYYPQEYGAAFCRALNDEGWPHQEESRNTGEKANRILIASRFPIQPLNVCLPDFDLQFPSNVLCVSVPSINISIVGVRIPSYKGEDAGLIFKAWEWLESASTSLIDRPSIILGDLNVDLNKKKLYRSKGEDYFRRILELGWHRAIPKGAASYYGNRGDRSEIDHILGTNLCKFNDARYIKELNSFLFAGGKDEISDHAALLVEVAV